MADQHNQRLVLRWFKTYGAEVLAKTADLSPHEFGTFWRIICAMSQTDDCTLLNDQRRLRMISGVRPNHWSQIWKAIEHLFDLDGERLTNLELREQHRGALAAYHVKEVAGSLGGQTTAAKSNGRYPNLWKGRKTPSHRTPITGLLCSTKIPTESIVPSEAHPNRFQSPDSKKGNGSPPSLAMKGSVGSLEPMSKALARSLQNLGENVAEKERKEATTEIDNEEPRSS